MPSTVCSESANKAWKSALKHDASLYTKKKYTNSLVNATFGSGKKSCQAKLMLTKLVNMTWREMCVSEVISVS